MKKIIRYSIRLVPVVIVVAALAWFFWFRPTDGKTNTAETTDTETEQEAPETTTPNPESVATAKPEEKVEANDDTLAGKSGLPTTGPGDTIAIFVITAVAGTLFWEWRIRKKRYG